MFQRLIYLFLNWKIKTGFEPEAPQYSERIVFEGDQRRKRGPDNLLVYIVDALFSVVFNLVGIDVVEERVDGEIPPEGISERSSHLYLGNSWIFIVAFWSKIDKVYALPVDFGRGCL